MLSRKLYPTNKTAALPKLQVQLTTSHQRKTVLFYLSFLQHRSSNYGSFEIIFRRHCISRNSCNAVAAFLAPDAKCEVAGQPRTRLRWTESGHSVVGEGGKMLSEDKGYLFWFGLKSYKPRRVHRSFYYIWFGVITSPLTVKTDVNPL